MQVAQFRLDFMLFESLDKLRNPAVIVALGGWADAANAGVDLAEHLIDHYPGEDLSPINDEKYFDYQQYRPVVHNEPEGTWIEWPGVILRVIRHPERDLLIVVGPEPHLRWRSFAAELLERIRECYPSIVIILGAMLADSPHTRPLPVGVYSNTPGILDTKAGTVPLDYSGPSGALGVLAVMLDGVEIPTAQVWVSIPHYVADPPNPKAQLELILAVENLLGTRLDRGKLEDDSARWTEAVSEVVAENPSLVDYVGDLEIASDAEAEENASGDRIAAEIEKYLRGRS